MSIANVSIHPAITLGEVEDRMRQATIKQIKKIVKISNESLATPSSKGLHYPSDIPSTDPQYEELRDNGGLASGCAPAKYFASYRALGWPYQEPLHFIAQKNVLPSDALEAAIQGPTIGDCGMTCQLARYGALLDILGKEKFNKLFSDPNQLNTKNCLDPDQPMRFFVQQTFAANLGSTGTKNNRPVQPGDFVYFWGVSDYGSKHPFGHAQGLWCVCVEKTSESQKYVGLGLPENGVDEETIEKLLLDEYNKPNTEEFSGYPPDFHAKLENRFPELKDFSNKTAQASDVFGYLADHTFGYNHALIQDLVNRDITQISLPKEQSDHPLLPPISQLLAESSLEDAS